MKVETMHGTREELGRRWDTAIQLRASSLSNIRLAKAMQMGVRIGTYCTVDLHCFCILMHHGDEI